MPNAMTRLCVQCLGIAPETPAHQVSSAQRREVRKWIKDLRMTITTHRGVNEAMVTAGGISLSEVSSSTMESRIVSGLHFAGEILDIDGDTGGYNLQSAFSTGWIAGRNAASHNTTPRDKV